MEFYNKPDDGRQHRRQSKDFGDIVSFQSEIEIKDFEWDRLFHNWEDPDNCSQNRHHKTCAICDMIKEGKQVNHLRAKTDPKYEESTQKET
jgi:hypothetical protein